jgi:hypothetical protein
MIERIIFVEVPKEIWNADCSIRNIFGYNILGTWMTSIQDLVKQLNDEQKRIEGRVI